jgi:hypothetical protein
MKNPTLVAHTPAAIAMMIFFLFQIAMLAKHMSKPLPQEDGGIAQNAEDNVHAEHNQEGSASNG